MREIGYQYSNLINWPATVRAERSPDPVRVIRFIRRAVKAAIPPVLFLMLAGYFGWNATQGAHGMNAYHQQLVLKDQAIQSQKDSLAERNVWTRRVTSLKERALDGDTLDERSRAMLNLARSGDLVVPYGPHDKLY